MSRVVIVGGGGFVGRPLVKELLDLGHEVTVLDDFSVVPGGEIDPRAIVQKFDACSWVEMTNFFHEMKEVNCLFWLVAKQGYSKDYKAFGSINVQGAYNLFEAIERKRDFTRIDRIVLGSSQAVYRPGRSLRESAPKEPTSIYGMTKWQQESTFRRFCEDMKIPFCALRYSIILGPGQSMQSSESGILRNWYRDFKSGNGPQVYGNGKQLRDFVHVSDVTRANVEIFKVKEVPRAINVGGFQMTVEDMASIFCREIGAQPYVVTHKSNRPGGEFTMTSDSSLAMEAIKWEPSILCHEQIRDWLLDVRSRKGIDF